MHDFLKIQTLRNIFIAFQVNRPLKHRSELFLLQDGHDTEVCIEENIILRKNIWTNKENS